MLTDPRLPGVELLQARFVRYRYAPHWHEALCVAVVSSGAAAFDCSGTRHVAPAGSVFVIPTGAVHAFSTGRDILDIIAFHPDSVTGPTDEHHQMLDATLAA